MWRLGLAFVLAMASWSLQAASPLERADCLVQAYPEWVRGREGAELLLADGSRMAIGSGTEGDFESRLDRADLHDQMSQCYPVGVPAVVPARDQDPGRLRHEPFFRRLFGDSESAVRARLRPVRWAPAGQSLTFTSVAGADRALERVGQAIAARPELARLVAEPVGSFHWRKVQGTRRLSNHSFGAAIDFKLPRQLGRYWLWSGCRPGAPCRYPEEVLKDPGLQEVVALFEAHGFIWGGKWYHHDTIHFEYRPELLEPGCRC